MTEDLCPYHGANPAPLCPECFRATRFRLSAAEDARDAGKKRIEKLEAALREIAAGPSNNAEDARLMMMFARKALGGKDAA